MQNQIFTYGCLGFQCLLYCTDSQVGGNVPIRNAGYHAAVMQIDYGAIIPYTAILQEKICKVSSPFLVNLFCLEILVQQIIKNLVYCAFLVIRLLPSNNGMKIQLLIHVVMNSKGTKMNMLSFQENLHAAVTIHTVMLVVYRGDFLEHTLFLGTISRLPVFQEVVVGIGANVEFTQQPAHAKFMMMFLDEPISR